MVAQDTQHLFILNPRSFPLPGALDRMKGRISDFFAAREAAGAPHADYSVEISTYPREAIILIHDFVAKVRGDVLKPEPAIRVYAAGGDGIAFDCVNGIVGLPNIDLALLPYGSSNDFVRNFGPGAAVIERFRNLELQTSAPTIATDVIKVSNQQTTIYCICDALFGLEASAAYSIATLIAKSAALPTKIRRVVKNLLYTWGGLKAVFNKEIIREEYTVIADGEDISGAYASINISNIPCYGGDKNPTVSAVPTDGLLDMITVKRVSSLHFLTLFTSYLRGDLCRNTHVFTLRRVRKVTIKPKSPQLMTDLDGEAFFDMQATVEVLPGAIRIVDAGGAGYRQWPLSQATKDAVALANAKAQSVVEPVETTTYSGLDKLDHRAMGGAKP
jgi:diacylglycerol kinase family enzyme